jgi:hypothetical protein
LRKAIAAERASRPFPFSAVPINADESESFYPQFTILNLNQASSRGGSFAAAVLHIGGFKRQLKIAHQGNKQWVRIP